MKMLQNNIKRKEDDVRKALNIILALPESKQERVFGMIEGAAIAWNVNANHQPERMRFV